MKAHSKWTIIKYEKEDGVKKTSSGILLLSEREQALQIKGKTRVIKNDPDANLPDRIRMGKIVSTDLRGLKEGTIVLFNKHDAFGFEFDETYFYAIKSELVIASLE